MPASGNIQCTLRQQTCHLGQLQLVVEGHVVAELAVHLKDQIIGDEPIHDRCRMNRVSELRRRKTECWRWLNHHTEDHRRRERGGPLQFGNIDNGDVDITPMQRAVAFCQVIEPSIGKAHKVSSKQISEMFQSVIDAYQQNVDYRSAKERDDATFAERKATMFRCEAAHVDGSMNAAEKEAKISWLKESPPENTCRILSNVRFLSEGVDVPALDAVLFLSPRSSQVEVVQAVGRVMRTS
jgi:predicted helicase